MWLLGKIMAGLVLLLATISTYVRLDDYSKGYYSGWLRFASIVAAAGVGLLLLLP